MPMVTCWTQRVNIRNLFRRTLAQLTSKLDTHYTSQVHMQITLEFLNTRKPVPLSQVHGNTSHPHPFPASLIKQHVAQSWFA